MHVHRPSLAVTHARRHAVRLALSLLATSLLALPAALPAQPPPPADSALVAAFRWRNIGPASMGGRIVDIEAVERDFATVYVATASGGVFKSVNAGTTWTPIFDDYASASIGDVAVFQADPDIVWVGTGEANNRNSVAWGDGVYRSDDGGKTFRHLGLASTHQIARVRTHPTDPNTAWVCAIGHLWGYAGERGLFRTTDGGATWSKLAGGLPDDGKTGCTDLVLDPSDPDVLYSAFYHRLRRPWHFQSGGPAGGIYKSTDGGRTWRELTAGLPAGETGRIGLDVYRKNPRILVALVEAARSDDLARPGSGLYRSEDGGETWTYVNTYNNRPFYYSQVRVSPTDSSRVYLLTTRFMVSDDGGRTLRNGSEDEEIHGDFHALWIDPADGDRYWVGMDKGFALTHDHGRSFTLFDNLAIGQYYRIGVDMRDPYHVYGGLQDNGSWGGPSFSRDARGILNDETWKLHWGDGQDVQVDPTDWRRLYTSMENGGVRRYDVPTQRIELVRPTRASTVNWDAALGAAAAVPHAVRYNWSAPFVMSPHDPRTLWLGGNHLFRTTDGGESWTIVSPDLSTRDSSKIVPGRSGGVTPDNTGAETHGTATTVSESPVTPGLLWVGTDDGNLWLTRDGGRSWTDVRGGVRGVPRHTWVARVEASHHDPAVAYVTFDAHRDDVVRPWLFRTADYGRTWTEITGDLPRDHPVHVVREDPKNPRLLFAGSEVAVYASLDGGRRWTRLASGMPTVATQDLVIHPRDGDLIAGTHGRSLFVLDDITPLQQLTPAVLAQPAHLFTPRTATIWENASRGGQRGHFWFAGENPPTIRNTGSLPRAGFANGALLTYYLKAPTGGVTLEIAELQGGRTRRVQLPDAAGIQRYVWDLRFDAPAGTPADEAERLPAAGPGSYRVTLTAGGERWVTTLHVRPDPLLDASPRDGAR